MIRRDLTEKLARHMEISIEQADRIVLAFTGAIMAGALADGRVVLQGFGSFTVKDVPARVIPNPHNGNPLHLPAKDLRTVVNNGGSFSAGKVYIGRDSRDPHGRGKWGNPFPIIKGVRTREQSIAEFKEYFFHPDQAGLRALARLELVGAILVCYCPPLPCHGHIIAAYVNGEEK